MPDAPDPEPANRPKHHQQRKPRGIGNTAPEIDDDAERASCNCSSDPDPGAADSRGQENGREIGHEEYVGTDLRESPPGYCRQSEAAGRESRDEKQGGLGYYLTALSELFDQFFHRDCHFT